MALEIQTPDYLAFARMAPPSPLGSAVGGALSGYQNISRLHAEREQAKQLGALRDVQIQAEKAKLSAMPEQQEQQRQQAELNRRMTHTQIAAARMSNQEAGHLYLSHRLSDLMAMPADQRASAYNQIKTEMGQLGMDTSAMPSQYGKEVESLGNIAVQSTPTNLANRKFQQDVILQEMKNRAQVQAAKLKAGGKPLAPGEQIPAGARAVPGGVISPTEAPNYQGVSPTPGTVPTQAASIPIYTQAATPAAGGLAITPTKATEDAFSRQLGQSFGSALGTAGDQANHAQQALTDINTFLRAAPQIPAGTGPVMGYAARFSEAGQRAIKAQNRLALTLLSMQKFGRVTNKEMGIVQNSTLNVHMDPAAYQKLAPQLAVISQRTIEYQKFLNAAANLGIRNIGTVDTLWNKYQQENPVIDTTTGEVNKENISNWQKYLSPEYLKAQYERPVFTPKNFVFPGSPEALRRGAK